MKVILSIKPEFAAKIFEGTKKYEFRKIDFKRSNVKSIIVYASSPVQRVIGEFEICDIIKGELEYIWRLTKDLSGITKDFYREYYLNKSQAVAIKVGKTHLYEESKSLSDFGIKYPPQSFMYID